MDNSVLVKDYGNGVFRLRGIYSKKEFDDIFKTARDGANNDTLLNLLYGKVLPSLFNFNPVIKDKLVNEKLTNTIKGILNLNENELVITQHSDFHINTLGGWHKDLGQGSYSSHEDAVKSKIYKFGLIKQSIEKKVNLATQFFINGKIVVPEIVDGDVILFPTYILHRGYPGNFFISNFRRIFSRLISYERLYSIINNFNKFFKQKDREAIFFTFGKDSEMLSDFENANLQRAEKQFLENRD